jgi:SOS-response transcriptional repressor LexA
MTTIDEMKPDAKRLLDACRDLKHLKNFADVARLLGESEQTLSNWKKRGVPKNKTVEICGKVGCRPEWLETGIPPMENSENVTYSTLHTRSDVLDYAFDKNVSAGPAIRGEVPLISWVQAGAWSEVVDNYAPNDAEIAIPSPVPVKGYTYALRVVGDSMTNPNGWPSFPEGMIVIVEPEFDHEPGDFVIVKNGHNEATFKQLIKDGADWLLKPLNPRYPIKPMPIDATICGVVRGYGGIIR